MIHNLKQKTTDGLFDLFRLSIFAGICIGIAGFGFLVSKPLGMFLFIFGLATVVKYKLKLFTGTAGFVTGILKDKYEGTCSIFQVIVFLIGNLVGCLLVALMVRYSGSCDAMQDNALNLLQGRLKLGWLSCGIQAIGCGILMTTAVTFAKQGNEIGNWVPLLLAVPLFIHCGFPHCIADAFYYMSVRMEDMKLIIGDVVPLYISIVIGNFIGCNLYRLFVPGTFKEGY